MATTSSGKFRTNLTLTTATHQWLRQHSTTRGMGELIDQLVLKERLSRTLEDRVAALEARVKQLTR